MGEELELLKGDLSKRTKMLMCLPVLPDKGSCGFYSQKDGSDCDRNVLELIKKNFLIF